LLPEPPGPAPDERGDLAAELAAGFGQMVESFRQHVAPTPEEAARLAADAAASATERALSCPPDQLTWFDLYSAEQADPQKSLARWEEVKAAAREELRNGHRAGRTVETTNGGCWERAQFLALRAELEEEWRPRGALERQLIDQLAQHRTLMERWQTTLTLWTGLTSERASRAARSLEPYEPPRLSDAEAIEHAARMVERFSRLYLHTLRELREQRRQARPVVVRGARQVNIAGQQVNLAR
jgi:hypothetical protein